MFYNFNKHYGAQKLLFLCAIGVLGFVYITEFVFGYNPCQLCLWQRYPWWIVAGICLLALLLSRHISSTLHFCLMRLNAMVLCGGGVIAGYHVGVEYQWWQGLQSCNSGQNLPQTIDAFKSLLGQPIINQCAHVSWSFLDFSMAAWNGFLSFSLAIIVWFYAGTLK
ncbi:MAG: disulfide bond formation protein B [Pseudomonadota bacterium]